jgi:hypothetical protein
VLGVALAAPPQLGDDGGEISRQRDGERQAGAGRRVDEAELCRVQREARHPHRVRLRLAVDLVTEHRVAEEREVDAHLVGPAGVQLGLDQHRPAERLDRADHRARRAAAARQRGTARSGGRAADTAVDAGCPRQRAGDEREVAPGHGVEAELLLQVACRAEVPGQHHHPRGVPVETVDDVQPVVTGLALGQFGQAATDNRVVLAIERRVNDQTGRFVDHDHVGVEVEDRQRREARAPRQPWPGGVVADGRTVRDPRSRVDDHDTVNQDVAGRHLALGARV